MMTLDEFNGLDGEAVAGELAACCSSATWAGAVAGRRPYPTLAAMLAASDAAVAALSEDDLGEALAGHPRIGDRRATGTDWSRQEQAGVSAADDAARQALAEGNTRYEATFGHIYLACATGRTATELLAFLHERLGNDRETEWRVVAAELAKINQIRLRKLIGDAA